LAGYSDAMPFQSSGEKVISNIDRREKPGFLQPAFQNQLGAEAHGETDRPLHGGKACRQVAPRDELIDYPPSLSVPLSPDMNANERQPSRSSMYWI
jgi:hypothetical protein